jgi:twitching motility two-component system response regulator PilG
VLQQRLLPDNSLPELLEMMTELGLIKPGELEDALWLNLLTDFDRYLFECAPHRSRERVNRYRLSDEQRQKLHALTKDGQSLEAIAQKLCREMCSAPLTRSAGGS